MNLSSYVPKANMDHIISGQGTVISTLDHTTPRAKKLTLHMIQHYTYLRIVLYTVLLPQQQWMISHIRYVSVCHCKHSWNNLIPANYTLWNVTKFIDFKIPHTYYGHIFKFEKAFLFTSMQKCHFTKSISSSVWDTKPSR